VYSYLFLIRVMLWIIALSFLLVYFGHLHKKAMDVRMDLIIDGGVDYEYFEE
jgi:hypothetical protein